MYISTFTPLQSALSGINAAQEELETSSDNIANASTPGYTDESANLGENLPLTIAADNGAGVQVGTGVDVDSVTSARDQFLDAAYRTQNAFASSASGWRAPGLCAQISEIGRSHAPANVAVGQGWRDGRASLHTFDISP